MKGNKLTRSRQIIKWGLFSMGLFILTFGAWLILLSGLGVSGLDAVAIGLATRTGMSIGISIVILGAILIMVGNIMNRRISMLPIGTSIAMGGMYDLWGIILFNKIDIIRQQPYAGYVFLIGLLIAPFGASLYILSEICVGPVDYLMLVINKKRRISLQNSRILLESIFVLAGWLAEGPIGVGTVCIMLFWGPILQVYYNWLEPRIKKYLKDT